MIHCMSVDFSSNVHCIKIRLTVEYNKFCFMIMYNLQGGQV